MSTNAGPFVVIGLIILSVAVALFLIFKFAVPKVFELAGWKLPWGDSQSETEKIVPEITPHPLEQVDLAQLQKEIHTNATERTVLQQTKYLSDPMKFGDLILLCGGVDETGGPKNKKIYTYNVVDTLFTPLNNITLVNDDFFAPQMNDKYLIWLDHKRKGGGLIRAQNVSTKEIFTVKEYYVGKPNVRLQGENIAWIERTGTNMDKVFLFNLQNKEGTTLDMLEKSPFGMSDVWVSEKEVVWANYDQNSNSSDKTNIKGAIHSVRLDGVGGEVDEQSTNTYVFNPMSNGDVRVWIDTNNSPEASLYMSQRNGAAVKIAENVTGYGIGSDFIAYCSNEKIHVYLLGEKGLDRIISPPNERCMFSGVSQDTIFWYERGLSDRDIIKYADMRTTLLP